MMLELDDDKRQRFITALMVLLDHVGAVAPAQSAETDRLALEVFEAAAISQKEFEAAQAAIKARAIPKRSTH